MDVKIEYSEQAQIDVHKVKCFFDILGKGEDFLEDLFRHEDLIKLMPEMYQIKYKVIRIANLENFKYAIHYIFQNGQIFIYRVYPHGQDYKK